MLRVAKILSDLERVVDSKRVGKYFFRVRFLFVISSKVNYSCNNKLPFHRANGPGIITEIQFVLISDVDAYIILIWN